MSRNDKARKRGRKERKLREREASAKTEEEHRLHPPDLGPINHSRLRQLFSNMTFRSHEKGGTMPFKDFVFGPNVEAKTPQELVERTDAAHVEATLTQKPS